jgi:hypothetical protein
MEHLVAYKIENMISIDVQKRIEVFMSLNFNKINELSNSEPEPQLTILLEESNSNDGDCTVLFVINHAIELENDHEKNREDLIFLMEKDQIFLLKSLKTNYYEKKVNYPHPFKSNFYYSYESVKINYCIHRLDALPIPYSEIIIPKKDWEYITSYLNYNNMPENAFVMMEFENETQEPFFVVKKGLGTTNNKTILYGVELNNFFIKPEKTKIYLSGEEKTFAVIGDRVTSPIMPTACRTLSKGEKQKILMRTSLIPELEDLIDIIKKQLENS